MFSGHQKTLRGKMKFYFSFFILFFTLNIQAKSFHGVLTHNIGMVNLSLTENESTIEQTDTSVSVSAPEEQASTAVSSTSFQLQWEFKNQAKKSYFLKGTVPLMSSGGTGVFLGGVGINFYLNPLGSKYSFNIGGSQMVIIPKFKYYWGLSTGLGYVVYNTESAQKSDVFFDLGLQGGAVYGLGKKWGVKSEIIASRATGVTTTGIKTAFLFGATYYL